MPAKRELTMRQLRYMLRLHHDERARDRAAEGPVLRSRDQPQLSHEGGALRRRHPAGTSLSAAPLIYRLSRLSEGYPLQTVSW
jgi:hypothetical protein